VTPEPFRFCPMCGGDLSAPGKDGGTRCPRCDRTWYRNPAPTVGVALVRDGRALVTVRAGEPEKGRIDVPGGFLAPEEDALEGLRREVREELGVEIAVADEDCSSFATHRYGDDGIAVLAIGFVGWIVEGEPRPDDDVADVRWVTADELDEIDFAWPHDRELVRRALERAQR